LMSRRVFLHGYLCASHEDLIIRLTGLNYRTRTDPEADVS
jgi:hypothetical protein